MSLARAGRVALLLWLLLTAGLIVMVALIEVLFLQSSSSSSQVLKQPDVVGSQLFMSGAWRRWTPAPSTLVAAGTIKVDNSTTWQSRLVVQPSNPAPGSAWGSLRLDSFEFSWPGSSLVFLVVKTNTTGYGMLPCSPYAKTATVLGNVNTMGAYNCLLAKPLVASALDTVFYLLASSAIPATLLRPLFNDTTLAAIMAPLMATQVVPLATAPYRLVGYAAMQPGSVVASLANETLGQGGSFYDVRRVLGQYADVSAFLLYVAIILNLEVLLSLLLTPERRKHMGVFILVAACAMLQDVFVAINFESVTGAPSPDNRACQFVGSFLHLFCLAAVGSYACASINVFCLLFRNGKYQNYSFSVRPLLYLVSLAVFVLLNFVIVWALRAVSPVGTLSYGPLGVWAFCWIANEWVLLGFFFAPASIVMLFNLTVSLYLVAAICHVRARARGVTKHTIQEVASLFFTVNSGSVACGILALLFFAFNDDPVTYLSLVTAILFLLQAISLWLVFFLRRENMALWGLFLTCSLEDRNKVVSTLSTSSGGNDKGHSDAPLNRRSGGDSNLASLASSGAVEL